MPGQPSSALVLGASMSGLLAARVLSDHFDEVVIVERDRLPDEAEARKGVPQARHAHGLLASGYQALDGFFPGLMAELEAGGAPGGDVVGDFLWFQFGRWKLRHETGLYGITVSRPYLESGVLGRVRALPNVTFLEGVEGVRPTLDVESASVSGLEVRRLDTGDEEALSADLVVDAGGRGSQSPKWLEEWGYGRPEELLVKVDVGYATRTFQRRPGDFFDSMGGIIAGTPPQSKRLAAVLAAEGDRWVITLGGLLGDFPPNTEDGWCEFAASLPVPAVHELVTSAPALTDIATYRFPANQRRRYERMKRFPAGYLVMGDAVCSFNPIYGQGMSVAAMEARALDDVLSAGEADLWQRFYARASKIVDIPWAIATGEDLRYPEVEGKRPPGPLNRYLERVHAAASVDPFVCRKFFAVLNLLAPPSSLMSPGVAGRVLFRSQPRGEGSPLAAGATVH